MREINEDLDKWTAATAKSLQSCPTLCDPIDGSPPGSPVPGILQARTLEWVAIPFSSAWKWKVKVKSLTHVWFLATNMDCSLPGSSVHGIFQARVLEWGCHCLLLNKWTDVYKAKKLNIVKVSFLPNWSADWMESKSQSQ